MRSEEVAGRGSPVHKHSLRDVAEQAWNNWEIHFLILTSLFLQVFLFLTAGFRRHTSSWILRMLVWLAYLSADSVAVFVLGHLAVRATAPGHQLMAFWAPFLLLHLGGQDTITAFSRQDNELYRRHLLNLVTQVAVTWYVVAKVSWRNSQLKAAMAVVFFSGCVKYAERIWCLYWASPGNLNYVAMVLGTRKEARISATAAAAREEMGQRLERISKGSGGELDWFGVALDVVALDSPLSDRRTILVKEDLPGMLEGFLQSRCASRYRAYDYVAAYLQRCYDLLHTKTIIRCFLSIAPERISPPSRRMSSLERLAIRFTWWFCYTLYAVCTLVQCLSSWIALTLFWAGIEKGGRGGQLQSTSSTAADITVSYILLVGAVALDMSSVITLIFSTVRITSGKSIPALILNILRPSSMRKQYWQEELAQYSIIKRHAIGEDTATAGWIERTQQWIRRAARRYNDYLDFGTNWLGFLEVTSTPIETTKAQGDYHRSPMKLLILDNLLTAGARAEFQIASSRGRLALGMFVHNIRRHRDPTFTWTGKALKDSIEGRGVDFPTSVCIWHIATDMCYFHDAADSANHGDQQDKLQLQERKKICRQLSSYIMYLVFQCGVTLTADTQILHDRTHREIRECISQFRVGGRHISEKQAAQELLRDQGSNVNVRKVEDMESEDDAAVGNEAEVQQRVLPRACEVVQELIANIKDETERWGLIADVWTEMLYYAVPRCGPAFHYEKLSAGGEFATHVLLSMHLLGQYLPATDHST